MTEISNLRERRGVGDTAVDGLVGGLMAGAGMAAYLGVAAALTGESVVAMIARFDPAGGGNGLAGLLAHLAAAGVYGLLFTLVMLAVGQLRPLRPTWLLGMVYGLVLAALARGVLLPAAGSPLLEIGLGHFAAAHLVYGALLGFWLR